MIRYFSFLTLILLFQGCQDIYEDFPVPEASVVADFEFEVIDADNRIVQFTNTSIIPESAGQATYTWSFGDEITSGEESPTHSYPAFSEYTVKLVVTTTRGGIAESSSTLVLTQPLDIDFTLFYMDTNVQTIFGVGNNPSEIEAGGFGNGIAIDNEAAKLYFVDDDNLQIKRCNLDGTDVEVLYDDFSGVSNIALDTENGFVFWTNRQDGSVHRGRLDGSGSSEMIINTLSLPEGIAYHAGKIYISDVDVPPVGENIYVANANGSGLEVLVPGAWGYGMAIDPVNERLYFGDQAVFDNPDDNRIKSVNMNDPTDLTSLVSLEPLGSNGSRTYGITVRPDEGKFYWTDRNASVIKRANLDGTGVESILVVDGIPRGLAAAN